MQSTMQSIDNPLYNRATIALTSGYVYSVYSVCCDHVQDEIQSTNRSINRCRSLIGPVYLVTCQHTTAGFVADHVNVNHCQIINRPSNRSNLCGCRGGCLEQLVDLRLAITVADFPHNLAQPIRVLHPGYRIRHLLRLNFRGIPRSTRNIENTQIQKTKGLSVVFDLMAAKHREE